MSSVSERVEREILGKQMLDTISVLRIGIPELRKLARLADLH